jgi:hypothetical protein
LAVGAEDVVGGPIRQHSPSGIENDHAVDQVLPDPHSMFDDDEGRTRLLDHASNDITNFSDPGWIKVRCGLVEQHQSRPHGKDTGESEPLLLPTGQTRRRVIERKLQSNRVERPPNPWPDLVAGHTQVLARERNIVTNPGENDLRVGVLQHEARTTPHLGGTRTVDSKVPELVTFLITTENPSQPGEESGLSRAGGTEQEHPLPRRYLQGQLRNGRPRAAGVPPAPPCR